MAQRKAKLIAAIETALSDFAKACRAQDTPVLLVHQDAFAAEYQEEEYRLFGMAIKSAGLCGKELRIMGTNLEHRSVVNQDRE